MQAVSTLTSGQVIALDGKQLRGSGDGRLGQKAITMVSAFATQNHLVLAQTKVDEKSNEITALPKLLEILEIAGCIITIDAIGCQTDIAAQIVDKKADYVLALKANQGRLYEDTAFFFAQARHTQFAGIAHDYHKTVEKDHGRIEIRECWVIDPHLWPEHFCTLDDWAGLQAIACIRSERRILATNKIENHTSYYIASLAPKAKPILGAKRSHWGIENTVHWTLDISFDEDNNRAALALLQPTFPGCATLPSTCSSTRSPLKPASRPSVSSAPGMIPTSSKFCKFPSIKMQSPCAGV